MESMVSVAPSLTTFWAVHGNHTPLAQMRNVEARLYHSFIRIQHIWVCCFIGLTQHVKSSFSYVFAKYCVFFFNTLLIVKLIP